MSQLEGIARSVAWACGFAALGVGAGVLVDGILGKRLNTISKSCGVKAFVQLAVGLGVLAEAIAVVIPAETVAPISDGLMFYWFFQSQPHLAKNMKDLQTLLSHSLFPQGPSHVTPPVPGDDPAPSGTRDGTKPRSEADELRAMINDYVDPFDPSRPAAGW